MEQHYILHPAAYVNLKLLRQESFAENSVLCCLFSATYYVIRSGTVKVRVKPKREILAILKEI